MSGHKRYLWLSVLVVLVLNHEWKMSWAAEGARNEVLINGVPLAVSRDEPGAQEQQKAEEKGQRKWVVQFNGPIRDTDKRQLEQLGCRIHEYLPEFAFLTTMTGEVKKKVTALPFIEGVARFTGEHKLTGKLRGKTATSHGEVMRIQLKLDGSAGRKQVTASVQRLKGRILDVGRDTLRVEVPFAAIAQLAALEEVLWVTEHVEMELFNDSMRWVIQTNTLNETAIWNKGIHGEGEIIGIGDSGLDYDTPWARDAAGTAIGAEHRKVVGYDTRYGDDYDSDSPGHGTHVFGTVAGDRTPVDGTDSGNGMAPKAKVFIQDMTPGATRSIYPPDDLGLLFGTAYNAGARLHTNSWGNSDTSYSLYAQSADRYLWEHKEFLVLFANGNSGPGAGTVGNPATAKNVISVGATLNGSSAESMASFSSNGPTRDGRIKPTVTAPGQDIRSIDSDGLKNSFNSGLITMSGTSMATPSVAGAAAMVRQYFRQGFYPLGVAAPNGAFVPSAALIKAVLINSAEDMTGTGTHIPSTAQGWGRINLSRVLPFAVDAGRLAVASSEPGLATGGNWSGAYYVPGGEPLKVTLVWTDFPGSPGAAKALVNDLDLSVTTPDGTTLFGNALTNGASFAGGAPDRLNVEEQVLIPAPPAGSYTVTVSGHNIPNGPQPFAIVLTGVSGVTSTATILLDRGRYRSDSGIVVKLADRDLNLDAKSADQATVLVQSTSEPGGETVTLQETSADSAIFSAVISLAAAPAAGADGRLQVRNGDTITVTFSDQHTAGGGTDTVIATAAVDDDTPVCSALAASTVTDTSATVSWTSNEPADSLLQYGTAQALGGSMFDRKLVTSHRLVLTGLLEAKRYSISALSADEAGNSGSCSGSFTTASLPPTLSVTSSRGETTHSSSTIISGISTDPSGVVSVKVNGATVSCRESDGYFETEVQLQIGINNVTVVATDALGNAAEVRLSVTRKLAPDLFMMTVSSPADAVQGDAITITDTVCNKGAGDSGSFAVGFYLSADQSYSAGDLFIGSRTVTETAAGECSTGSAEATIPSTAPGGTYHLLAHADYQQLLLEADRSNNTLTGNQVTLPHQLLAPPSNVSAPSTNSTGSIRVYWGNSGVAAATFVVEMSLNGGAWAQVASTTYTYAYVTVGRNGSYRFRVKAVKAGYGESGYGTTPNACVVTLVCTPPGPISVPATNASGTFRISWGSSSISYADYALEYSINGSDSWTSAALTQNTSLYFTAVENGSYRFRVKAVKGGYEESGYSVSNISVVTLVCAAPASVVVPTSNSDGAIRVSWGSSVSGANYVIEYQVNGGAWLSLPGTFNTYLNFRATGNGSYRFRVKTQKSGFADSAYTESANTCLVTLECRAPSSISVPASNTTGSFRISWGGSGDASYILEYSIDDGQSWTIVGGPTTTYWNYTATADGRYHFRVKAVKPGFSDSGYTTSTVCTVTRTCGTPGAITVPTSSSTQTFRVFWGGGTISGVTYLLEVSTNDGPYLPVVTTGYTYANFTTSSSGSYRFRVKAVKAGYADSGYSYSANSCSVSF